jgi:hypothetical protein
MGDGCAVAHETHRRADRPLRLFSATIPDAVVRAFYRCAQSHAVPPRSSAAHAQRTNLSESLPEAGPDEVMVASTVGAFLAGPFLAACVLLVLSGGGKLIRPGPARAAVRAAGIPAAAAVVAAFGVAELGAGAVGAITGGGAAVAVAACYGALVVFAVRLLRRAPSTPCACLGSSTAVVTPSHVVLDSLAACIALVAASAGSPWVQFAGHWFTAAVFVTLVLCSAGLASLVLESLPRLGTAAKEGTS